MFAVFLLIHIYTAGGSPSSFEGSTQELALQGNELTDGWQSQYVSGCSVSKAIDVKHYMQKAPQQYNIP